MMIKRILLSALFVLFTAILAFGQDLPPMSPIKFDTGTSIANGVLKRSGFSRLSIGEQKFHFREAGRSIADYDLVKRLNNGFRLEKAAIWLGASGAVLFGGGIVMFNHLIRSDMSGHVFAFMLAYPIIGAGAILGLTSIGLGIGGAVTISRAVKKYNNDYLRENVEGPILVRRGLKRFSYGSGEFLYKDSANFIDDPKTARMLRSGVTQEILGLSFGVIGVTALFLGAFDLGGLAIAGASIGTVGLVLGVSGSITTKKALERYNYYRPGGSSLAQWRLDVATTPGGMGLQLTF